MKKLLLCLLIAASLPAFAQKDKSLFPINADGEIEYAEVVKVDSATQEQLYSRAKLYVANAFNSSPDVTKLEDPATYTVVTKGLLPRNYTNPFNKAHGGNVQFKFTIQCKDGRYKYLVNELVHVDHNPQGDYSGGDLKNEKPACGGWFMTSKNWKKIKMETAEYIDEFIQQLKKTMAGEVQFSNNDW